MVVNGHRQGILSGRDFADIGVCYRDRMWLTKSKDDGEVTEGSVNRSKKRSAEAGLFFDSGDAQSIARYRSCC